MMQKDENGGAGGISRRTALAVGVAAASTPLLWPFAAHAQSSADAT
jgi:hypothetical protein